jgi:hypothetical protein
MVTSKINGGILVGPFCEPTWVSQCSWASIEVVQSFGTILPDLSRAVDFTSVATRDRLRKLPGDTDMKNIRPRSGHKSVI